MNENPDHLAPGHLLQEYRIEKTLGAGGFGVTYLALDTHLNTKVALKEFFPNHSATRDKTGTMIPRTSAQKGEFNADLQRFLSEAQTLAQFAEEPSIVRVRRYFTAMGTAYIVMSYIAGENLASRISREGGLTPPEVRSILLQISAGLEKVHAAGFLHRDIKPANILMSQDGLPVLIDFGAARLAIGAHSQPLSVILTPGYAPIEQYSEQDEQGPYTDIYGLSAVCYAALMGKAPPDATRRRRNDPYEPLAPHAQNPDEERLFKAIDWGLRPNEDERPQTIPDWRAAILGEREVPDPVTNVAPPTATRSSSLDVATARYVAPAVATSSDAGATVHMGRRTGPISHAPAEDAQTTPARKPKWLIPAGISAVAVLIAAIVGWQTFGGADSVPTTTQTAEVSDQWLRMDLNPSTDGMDGFGIEADGPIRVRADGKTYLIDGSLAQPAALGKLENDYVELRAVGDPVKVTLVQEGE